MKKSSNMWRTKASALAWLLAFVMIVSNVNIVQAAVAAQESTEGIVKEEIAQDESLDLEAADEAIEVSEPEDQVDTISEADFASLLQKVQSEAVSFDQPETTCSLGEGTYEIDAEFWHATNEALSSANDTIVSTELVVAADGTATVYINLQSASGMDFHKFQYQGSNGQYCDVTIEEGTTEIPTRISFTLPSNVSYTNMKTTYLNPVMGDHTVGVRLYLVFENAVLVDDEGDSGNKTPDTYILEEGTYEINAEFWHATNEVLSSANDTIVSTELVVAEDGTATVYINLQSASGMDFYSFQYQGSDGQYYDVTIEEGTMEVPTRISFTLPSNVSYTNMKTTYPNPVMGNHTVGVRLYLDFEKAVLVDDEGDTGNKTPDGLEDGRYSIDAEFRQETSEFLSMADDALQSAYIEVEDGAIEIFLNMGDISGVYLQSMTYRDETLNIHVALTATKYTDGNITQFSMPIEEGKEVFTTGFTFDPTNTSTRVLMTQYARLVLDWDSVALLCDNNDDNINGDNNNDDDNNGDNNNGDNNNGDNNNGDNNNGDNNNGNDNGDDSNGNDSNGTDTLGKDNLADGIYEVEVDLWHVTQDQASMASDTVVKIARIQVSNGEYTIYLYTQPMTLGSITASLKYLQVENKSGGYTQASVNTTNSAGDPTSFTFAMPHTNEYIAVKVNPEVAIMGNTYIDARLKMSWDSLKEVSGDTNLNSTPDDSSVSGSSSSGISSVKTGDENNMIMLIFLMAGAAAITVYSRKRMRKEVL